MGVPTLGIYVIYSVYIVIYYITINLELIHYKYIKNNMHTKKCFNDSFLPVEDLATICISQILFVDNSN